MTFVSIENNIITPIYNDLIKDNITIPLSNILLWSEEERNTHNIYRVSNIESPKEWQNVTFTDEYELKNGKVYQKSIIDNIDIELYKKNKISKVSLIRKDYERNNIFYDNIPLNRDSLNVLTVLIYANKPVTWKINDGDYVDLTIEQLKNMFDYLYLYSENLFKAEKTIVSYIQAAKTQEEVYNINTHLGWPTPLVPMKGPNG